MPTLPEWLLNFLAGIGIFGFGGLLFTLRYRQEQDRRADVIAERRRRAEARRPKAIIKLVALCRPPQPVARRRAGDP